MEQQTAAIPRNDLELADAWVIFPGDYQRILGYILGMVRDPMLAEDLAQETFLRAYRRRDSLRAPGAQTAWLYRIATHVSLDLLRQVARRASLEDDTELDQVDVPERDSPSLQQTVERGEMSECVQRYLTGLPDPYRAVILLHDMEELTASEIAQLLGQSLPTVKIRLHRARQKLRSALQAGCAFAHDERNVLACESIN